MTGFWTSQRERISQWGLPRTLGYYLFAVVPDKVGIRISEAFQYPELTNALSRIPSASFSVLESMSDYTDRDLEILRGFHGDARFSVYREYFSRGGQCAVTRWDGTELACMLWLQHYRNYCQSPERSSILLTDGFTLPDHRGKGLYPQILRCACDYASTRWRNELRIYGECSVVNYASKKGLHKAGFVRTGLVIAVGNRSWYWSRRHSPHRRETIISGAE